ncbi:hypothetical protein HDV00_008141 [Rhizophlyctis rosea]|nr:hypothetical protein HDV00_008141 [Rhizophlyctis rosea]
MTITSKPAIGILGTGVVSLALAKGFITEHYAIKIGTRDPSQAEKLKDFIALGDNVQIGTFEEAAQFGAVIILATAATAIHAVLDAAKVENLSQKVLIDVNNPLRFDGSNLVGLTVGMDDSLGEDIQRKLPDTKVVKCWNIVGNGVMYKPSFPDGTATMLIAGNDASAKGVVRDILKDFGWESIEDMGGIEESRWLEAMCVAWCHLAFKSGKFYSSFALLKK